MRTRIFITIASYMDHELVPTVRSAIDRAADPERLTFGVVDQAITDSCTALTALSKNVAYVRVHPRESLGCCWARSIGQTFYDGEEIALQIDSHMRFDPGWDETIRAELEAVQARAGHSRALLTACPSGFSYDPAGRIIEQPHRTWKLVVEQDAPWNPETQAPPRSQSVAAEEDGPVPGRLIAAGFLVGPGNWIEELPYDPRLYFYGEETALALRAFTWGWDVFHPALAPLRHLYKRPRERGTSFCHWDGMFDASRRFTVEQLEARARTRLADLVSGRVRGAHGLGRVRPAADFWPEAGISLSPRPG